MVILLDTMRLKNNAQNISKEPHKSTNNETHVGLFVVSTLIPAYVFTF